MDEAKITGFVETVPDFIFDLVNDGNPARAYLFEEVFPPKPRPESKEKEVALQVLVRCLDDIEPLWEKPPRASGVVLNQLVERFISTRARRIAKHQAIEEALRKDGVRILREYAAKLRGLRAVPRGGWAESRRKQLRRMFEKRVESHRKAVETLDELNTALDWVLSSRAEVEFWCSCAGVEPQRFYEAVERRLLLKGRCSIGLKAILDSMRALRRVRPLPARFTTRPQDYEVSSFRGRVCI
jgi:hypothetical protein